MLRALGLLVFLSPAVAFAQSASDAAPAATNHQMMDHSKMHGQMMGQMLTEPGQSAFAAIQEIVEVLSADRGTDWAKVNIDALREHLVDMDAVTLHAAVRSEAVENGMRFTVTGEEPVRTSIRRMVTAHASTMNGVNDWQYVASETADGAMLTVTAPTPDLQKLKALGFFGILTIGMHHQAHHLMIARGGNPHH